MEKISALYKPLTSAQNPDYREYAPSPELAPYICCFWESSPTLVIPDGCMDLIFDTDNEGHVLRCGVCGLDDRAHLSGSGTKFGVRFYCWTIGMFSRGSFEGTKNGYFPAEEFFPGLENELCGGLSHKADQLEKYLAKRLDPHRQSPDLMNAVYAAVVSRGTAKVSELAAYSCVSERTLERYFREAMGVSPKLFCSLVRYQMVWRDFFLGASELDLVEKYGYCDQAHLINDFRRFHSMSPGQALAGVASPLPESSFRGKR